MGIFKNVVSMGLLMQAEPLGLYISTVYIISNEAKKLRSFALRRDSHEDSKLSKKKQRNIFFSNVNKTNILICMRKYPVNHPNCEKV